jgi:hypothetical protein
MKRNNHSKQQSATSSHASPSPANKMVETTTVAAQKPSLKEFEESEFYDEF